MQGGVNRKKSRASEDRLSGTPRQVLLFRRSSTDLNVIISTRILRSNYDFNTRLQSDRSQSSVSQMLDSPTQVSDATRECPSQGANFPNLIAGNVEVIFFRFSCEAGDPHGMPRAPSPVASLASHHSIHSNRLLIISDNHQCCKLDHFSPPGIR